MPSVIDKETIIGSNFRITEDGAEDTVIYFVKGLDAPGMQKKLQAATTRGIPEVGDAHPFIPGIVCRGIPRVDVHKGGFTAKVEAFYATPSEEDSGGGGEGPDGSSGIPGTVRLGAVYERVPSNYDTKIDGTVGKKIQIGHDWEAEIQENDENGGVISGAVEKDQGNSQTGEVNAYVARLTVILRGNTEKCPLSKAQRTGFTNADNFLQPIAGLFDAPPDGTPDTWLLIRSGANSTDNNASFDFEWEWAYKPETWHEIAVFIDPRTGRPPANISRPPEIVPGAKGIGTLVVRVAGQANFRPYVTLN
ncbi:MAG: hypothetical protein AAGI37_15440 [Planctomycetota bacterium]